MPTADMDFSKLGNTRCEAPRLFESAGPARVGFIGMSKSNVGLDKGTYLALTSRGVLRTGMDRMTRIGTRLTDRLMSRGAKGGLI